MLNTLKKKKFIWNTISFILRLNFSFFWRVRNFHPKNTNFKFFKVYKEDIIFKNFFKHISQASVVEIGSGYGLRLFNLRRYKKKFQLIGYDINRKSIKFAKKFNRMNNLNIKFKHQDSRKLILKNKIDYLISSFSLIYMNKKELGKFFLQNKNKIRKGFVLLEYHSEKNSDNLSYYVNNFNSIFQEARLNKFKIIYKKINKKNWNKKDHNAYKIIGYKNEN